MYVFNHHVLLVRMPCTESNVAKRIAAGRRARGIPACRGQRISGMIVTRALQSAGHYLVATCHVAMYMRERCV